MTFVVALTGGIGSGKTTVSNFFEELGVPVIDTDIIAKNLVSINTSCYKAIVKKFGKDILADDLSINRKKLRHIIFNDIVAKEWLEQLLHPKIIEIVQQKIAACHAPYCIVVIPLLIELYDKFGQIADSILVVDATKEMQYKRLIARDNISPDLVKKMLSAQSTREQRLERAHEVLANDKDLLTLKNNVFILHNRYLQLSTENNFR